jgi:hypothetical protein
MLDRLLNGYLSGAIDEEAFQAKSAELKRQLADTQEALERVQHFDPTIGEIALKTFRFSQAAVDRWRGSNFPTRREILTCVSSNRTLSDVSLSLEKRKPFDILAERPSFATSRGDWI